MDDKTITVIPRKITSKEDQTKFQGHENNIFDKPDMKQAIFNEMRPAKVFKKGKDFELKGMHFKSLLKEDAQDSAPWGYIENDKTLAFTHKEMRWDDGTVIKTGVNFSKGVTEKQAIRYKDALSPGIDIKIVQDNYKFQKIVEISSLESLGKIPDGAEYLEIDFVISGDFNLPDGDITARIPFGENSFVQPIRAWDKSEFENQEDEIKSGAVGSINGNVITKKIPVEWLKQAVYPVMTDISITYGSENVFNSENTYYVSATALDSTHFVVAYQDFGDTEYGICRVGTVSGTTITYGDENIFHSNDTRDISVTTIDSTHFLVAYSAVGGEYGAGAVRIGVTDGSTTISSYGTIKIFEVDSSQNISIALLDSTHFVVGYSNYEDSKQGFCVVGVFSGSTISSYGAINKFNAAETRFISVSVFDSTHFVVAYQDDGGADRGAARVGVVSGTTISEYGTEKLINFSKAYHITVANLDSTHFIIAYKYFSTTYHSACVIGSISDTTISWGTENIFLDDEASSISVSILDSEHFVVSYNDTINLYAIIGVISGTTISEYGNAAIFNLGSTSYTKVVTLDQLHFAIAYNDLGNGGYGTAIIGEIPSYGWSGIINGVSAPAKINGIAVENIAKVNGIE